MAMNEATALKLVRYCLEMRAAAVHLEEVGVSFLAFGLYEEVLEILLDDFGFPRDQTGHLLRKNVRPLAFCRDQIHDVYFALADDASDDDIRAALHAWQEMSKDLGQFYL